MSAHAARWLRTLLLISTLCMGGCPFNGEREIQGPPLRLTIAVRAAPESALIALADEKGYFRKYGLNVTTKLYPAGLLALEAMMRGEAEVATIADIAFASRMFDEPSLRVLASIGFSTASQIVARRDRDIGEPEDLRGKKVGFSPDTTSDYFLYAFLLTENISSKDVTAVPVTPNRQADAVVSGELDAVSAFDVYAFDAMKRLGDKGVAWDCQNNLGYQWLLATKASHTQSPEPLRRLLRALVKAEQFARFNEAEVKRILNRKWDLDPELLQRLFPKTRLSVSFSQTIIASLRNYGSWKMKKEGKEGAPTDLLELLYTDALEDVAPKAVTLFR